MSLKQKQQEQQSGAKALQEAKVLAGDGCDSGDDYDDASSRPAQKKPMISTAQKDRDAGLKGSLLLPIAKKARR